jgi:hypothetical protein
MPDGPGPAFKLTEIHLILLRRMYVEWGGDDLPYGAPRVSPKRPFGNGDPLADIIRLLKMEIPPGCDDAIRDEAKTIYGDLLHAVQIVMAFAGMDVTPGLYRRRSAYDSRSWERIGD